jgi:hypothetical protein
LAADDVAMNTMHLRVTTAANPKRESLTQSNHPNAKPKPTPKAMKKSQKSQPERDSTRVLRIEKIGSLFKIILLVTVSAKEVTAKRESPRKKLLIEGKRAKAERLIPAIHIIAIARRAFLYDGRKNMEE